MTRREGEMGLRVLGPLEAVIEGEPVGLGGAKQRSLLAALVLRAGEVVPIDRLIDEIWGENPPPSAAHSLEAYVSRLRQLFNGHGPELLRRGSGYALELGGATLDAELFVRLAQEVSQAAAEDDAATVARLAAEALALWRGPALAGVALGAAGRAEAERLEELRFRVLEQRLDADLTLGRHESVIGELQALVGQNPYRERFVAQLMLALYRSGRHADALEVYEQTRRRLDEDLGLQPSIDLQQLSGQVVRQDPELRRRAATPTVSRYLPGAGRPRRLSVLIAAGGLAAAALALSASGGAAVPEEVTPTAQRLALVLPAAPSALGRAGEGLVTAVDSGEILYDLETQTAIVDPGDRPSGTEHVAARIRKGGVGLVVVLGDGPGARALAKFVRTLPETRFVFVDASLSELALRGAPNAAAIRFADEDVLQLAGYLSGLVPTMDGSERRVDLVSVVAGEPTRDTARLIAGLERGLAETRPGVKVRVDYSRELEDPTACESLANRQIDAGSDVVVALAARCGLGALAVARFRGVWGIGAQEDGLNPEAGHHVLLATHKEWTNATLYAIEKLVDGTLPMGRDTALGLEDDYSVGLWFSTRIPGRAESAVIHRCTQIRASRHRDL